VNEEKSGVLSERGGSLKKKLFKKSSRKRALKKIIQQKIPEGKY